MSQRILVDLLGFTGARGGTETYARELLPRVAAAMPDVQFAAITGRSGAERVAEFFPGRIHRVNWVGADPASWAAGAVLATNTLARRNAADLVWAPANFGPIRHGVPRVVTVHDAIYDEVPGSLRDRAQRTATAWLMARSARTADAVITVSHAAAASICEHLGIPSERIHVVHNGSSQPKPAREPWTALADIGLPRGRQILLSVGNRMPHKNFRGLLDALALIPATQRPLTVIAGSSLPDPLSPSVARRGLLSDVVLPGWVSANQLEALYQVADLYVCPSLAEGFGLPILDALRRGVRVVANDIPVLREVGADSVAYADATNSTHLASTIANALRSPARDDDREAAQAWAETFTWERSAERTAEVLREALGMARRRR